MQTLSSILYIRAIKLYSNTKRRRSTSVQLYCVIVCIYIVHNAGAKSLKENQTLARAAGRYEENAIFIVPGIRVRLFLLARGLPAHAE